MGKIALKEQITLNFISLIISKYLDHTSGWKYSWDSQTPIIVDFLSDHFSTVVDASFPVSCRSKAAKIIHPLTGFQPIICHLYSSKAVLYQLHV